VIIRYESKSCRICYQVIDHVLIDFLHKSQKSLDFGIVPVREMFKYFQLYFYPGGILSNLDQMTFPKYLQ